MKTYRSARELAAEVKQLLAKNKPSFHHSPLDDVIEALCQGRHYSWMGVYLAVDEDTRRLVGSSGDTSMDRMVDPESRSKIIVAMKLAGREVGALAVETEREAGFGAEDRVLLENVATAVAGFLTGAGKYLARKARESGNQNTSVPAHGPSSVSERPGKSAAVGEK